MWISKSATFHLTGWKLLPETELPGDLPVPLGCHVSSLNMIALLLSDADTRMTRCSDHFKISLTSVHFVGNNACHALASSPTLRLTFNDEEEDAAIRNVWTVEE